MTEKYQKQVNLLLEVLQIAVEPEVFALKGGTAINFFFQNCPRLSVDIDLHYLPLNGREKAFRDIRERMEAINLEIKRSFYGIETSITDDFKILIKNDGILVNIEINGVIRGTLLPPVEMPLCPWCKEEFGRSMKVTCIAEAELYAGKFCAALHRQHPRDIFDAWLFFARGGELTEEILDAFVVYLISHSRPIHEVLDPTIKDIQNVYENRFKGMAKIDVSLENLHKTQLLLPKKILAALTERHRTFLLGFNEGKPDWNLLPFSSAKDLPAVHWKLINLDKMGCDKREKITRDLVKLFKNNPYKANAKIGVAMQDLEKKPKPQEQIAQEIVTELVERKLVSKAEGEKLQRQIANGTLTREDWLLLVEIHAGKAGEI